MPVFNKQFYSDTVPENIELHSPLSVAIQAESPLGRKLIYSIVKGNELEEFAVDFNTGKYMFLLPIFIEYYKSLQDKRFIFCIVERSLKPINNLFLVSINILMEAIYMQLDIILYYKRRFQSNMIIQNTLKVTCIVRFLTE